MKLLVRGFAGNRDLSSRVRSGGELHVPRHFFQAVGVPRAVPIGPVDAKLPGIIESAEEFPASRMLLPSQASSEHPNEEMY
jgi:hypothetical protein